MDPPGSTRLGSLDAPIGEPDSERIRVVDDRGKELGVDGSPVSYLTKSHCRSKWTDEEKDAEDLDDVYVERWRGGQR